MIAKKIVVADQAFGDVVFERDLARKFGAEFEEHQCTTEEETRRAAMGACVLFVNFAPVTRSVLEALAPGATIVRYGVGYDNVDIDAARLLGIRVANVPDYGVETVADHTVSLLLTSLRKIVQYDSAVRKNGWMTPNGLGTIASYAKTTVGLVGKGKIGLNVAKRLAPFGFEVIAYDPYQPLSGVGVRSVELDELFSASDAISLHCPLTSDTWHLVNSTSIQLMKRGTVLINTSRGGLIDHEAVADALEEGQLGGVAFDVFDPEPLPLHSRLRQHPNAIFTPHVAFYSTESLTNLQRLAAEEGNRAMLGESLRCPVT